MHVLLCVDGKLPGPARDFALVLRVVWGPLRCSTLARPPSASVADVGPMSRCELETTTVDPMPALVAIALRKVHIPRTTDPNEPSLGYLPKAVFERSLSMLSIAPHPSRHPPGPRSAKSTTPCRWYARLAMLSRETTVAPVERQPVELAFVVVVVR